MQRHRQLRRASGDRVTEKSKKAMKRLGAPMAVCPACSVGFQVRRLPRFWINKYVDGKLVDFDDFDGNPMPSLPGRLSGLCCSRLCADSFVEDLKREKQEQGVTTNHVVYRESAPGP